MPGQIAGIVKDATDNDFVLFGQKIEHEIPGRFNARTRAVLAQRYMKTAYIRADLGPFLAARPERAVQI